MGLNPGLRDDRQATKSLNQGIPASLLPWTILPQRMLHIAQGILSYISPVPKKWQQRPSRLKVRASAMLLLPRVGNNKATVNV